MIEKTGSSSALSGPTKLGVGFRLAIVLAALASLCICALAKEDIAEENSADSWYQKGYQLVSNGYYEEGLQAYNKSLEIDSGNATAWLDKALIHMILAKQARLKALDLFDENLEENPQDARAWWSRGVALYGLERPEEAKESWEKALEIYNETLKLDPEDAEAWFDKAEILISLGRNEEAIEAYDRAIELNSTRSAEAAMTKGNLLMEMGRYEEALAAYEKAVEVNPNFPSFWYYKGLALWALDRDSAAEEAFTKATEMGYVVTLPVVKEAGSGPVVTTRTEIAPER